MIPKGGRRFPACAKPSRRLSKRLEATAGEGRSEKIMLQENHCFVYVLGSADKGRRLTYVGWTNDLDKRLAKHNAGTGARTTRGRRWVLLHSEKLPTRSEAMSREWHLKRDRAFRKELAAERIENSE
jgi:putative endonuclease